MHAQYEERIFISFFSQSKFSLSPLSGSGKLDVRAMPHPRASTTSASSGEDTLNASAVAPSDLLDSQSSAENIRQSMQKYLQSKHQHLKKVSEKLAKNSKTGGAASSSMEDLAATTAAASLEDQPAASLPAAASASGLLGQTGGSNILRPCDQYPSEPGVLRASGSSSGGGSAAVIHHNHGQYNQQTSSLGRPVSAQSGAEVRSELSVGSTTEQENSFQEQESKVGIN